MKVSEFDYNLPKELIAKYPATPRDSSRLLVLDRGSGKVEHRVFRDIVYYIGRGDVLVLNDAKVIPARLLGLLDTGGKVEVFLVRRLERNVWEVLSKPARKMRVGRFVSFGEGLECKVIDFLGEGKRVVRFAGENTEEKIWEIGKVPLPPYIEREEIAEDRERYQTVFARREGAVAAPTAGLHFTEELLGRLREKGAVVKFLTLYVGLGTFRPVKVESVEEHRMESEAYAIPEDTAEAVNAAKHEGRRVIATGTTVTRALESAFGRDGVKPGEGITDLFIYPGYNFKVVDALITNFHLPRSTLLMLVCAFAGKERVLNAYREAVEKGYRFYSFGDAMLIL